MLKKLIMASFCGLMASPVLLAQPGAPFAMQAVGPAKGTVRPHEHHVYVSGASLVLLQSAHVNYEYSPPPILPWLRASVRVGLGRGAVTIRALDLIEDPLLGTVTTMPISAKLLLGNTAKSHFFVAEAGGYNLLRYHDRFTDQNLNPSFWWPLVDVGYRFHPPGSHFMLQTTLGTTGLTAGVGAVF